MDDPTLWMLVTDRLFDLMIAAVTVGLPVLLTLWWQVRKLKIEVRNSSHEVRSAVTSGVHSLNGRLYRVLNGFPFPVWVKQVYTLPDGSKETRMEYVNDAYTAMFGKTQAEYVGRRDEDVWGKELGQRYMQHDMVVHGMGRAMVFDEAVDLPGGKGKRTFRFRKQPIRNSEGTVDGVLGMMQELDILKDAWEILPVERADT